MIRFIFLAVLAAVTANGADEDALKRWYRQPARAWTQALPVGNGRLAAMVFGDARKEHLRLNEDTV
jgi:alpha-L-fucosidase 2